jgi:transposase
LKRQQQYEYAVVFGAICAASSQAVALVMPHSDTAAMQQHLDEISQAVPPSRHAVILMDRAPWHTTKKLKCPANISILPLPAVSPELNPVEQVWKWLRDHELSNRIFKNYEDIVTGCCHAWNVFASSAQRITSIGSRAWTKLTSN